MAARVWEIHPAPAIWVSFVFYLGQFFLAEQTEPMMSV